MKSETLNEPVVLNLLEKVDSLKDPFDVGMVTMKETPYKACSLDGILFVCIAGFEKWVDTSLLEYFE